MKGPQQRAPFPAYSAKSLTFRREGLRAPQLQRWPNGEIWGHFLLLLWTGRGQAANLSFLLEVWFDCISSEPSSSVPSSCCLQPCAQEEYVRWVLSGWNQELNKGNPDPLWRAGCPVILTTWALSIGWAGVHAVSPSCSDQPEVPLYHCRCQDMRWKPDCRILCKSCSNASP